MRTKITNREKSLNDIGAAYIKAKNGEAGCIMLLMYPDGLISCHVHEMSGPDMIQTLTFVTNKVTQDWFDHERSCGSQDDGHV